MITPLGMEPEIQQRNASINNSVLLDCVSDITPQARRHLDVEWRSKGELITASSEVSKIQFL